MDVWQMVAQDRMETEESKIRNNTTQVQAVLNSYLGHRVTLTFRAACANLLSTILKSKKVTSLPTSDLFAENGSIHCM